MRACRCAWTSVQNTGPDQQRSKRCQNVRPARHVPGQARSPVRGTRRAPPQARCNRGIQRLETATKRMMRLTGATGRYARRMRYPGESATGDTPGRRGSPSGRSAPTRPGPAPTDQPTPAIPSVFAPGYSTGRAGGRVSGRAAARGGDGHYGSTGGAANKGPIRGFPPAPGQPPPLYPPGQFSAWNRTSRSGGDALDGASPASGQRIWPTLSSTAGSVATAPPRADTTGRGYPGLDDPDLGHADLGRTDLGRRTWARRTWADRSGHRRSGHRRPKPGWSGPGRAEPGRPEHRGSGPREPG